ncbi:VOC family protein [Yoonia sp. SS1-5]|uniref:VOC family protein n=2 Tax=Yoonia rhodophyticola TaxID=3137370 RepID=A0AAN0NM72_9RHOB
MMALDHLAVAATRLEDGVAYVEDTLGVKMAPGGKHARYGTHNMLLGLGDIYLEVIAPDPDAAPFEGPRWFGLDQFVGAPRLANWICRVDDLSWAPPVCGPPMTLQRGDLSWQITVPADGGLPFGGALPTLMRWGAGVPHPTTTLPDSGCRLRRFRVFHPDAADIAVTPDPRVHVTAGPAGFQAVFDRPDGPVRLS